MQTVGDKAAFAADQSDGLTKREYFAAMAMIGIRAAGTRVDPHEISISAIKMADALIAGLNK